jgi:hypothetical protein
MCFIIIKIIKIDFYLNRLFFWEDQQNPLLKKHHENWYNVNIWSVCRDLIIRNVPGFDNIRYVELSYFKFSYLL